MAKARALLQPDQPVRLKAHIRKGTYISGDELARAQARDMGYRTVGQHPNDVEEDLQEHETLVFDWDHVLFYDRDLVVEKANAAASQGVRVGIHTYYRRDPRLRVFLAWPNVVIAKTHRRVLAALRGI